MGTSKYLCLCLMFSYVSVLYAEIYTHKLYANVTWFTHIKRENADYYTHTRVCMRPVSHGVHNPRPHWMSEAQTSVKPDSYIFVFYINLLLCISLMKFKL